jgi:hypothetical protein
LKKNIWYNIGNSGHIGSGLHERRPGMANHKFGKIQISRKGDLWEVTVERWILTFASFKEAVKFAIKKNQ